MHANSQSWGAYFYFFHEQIHQILTISIIHDRHKGNRNHNVGKVKNIVLWTVPNGMLQVIIYTSEIFKHSLSSVSPQTIFTLCSACKSSN